MGKQEEWRVMWFPPDKPAESRTYVSEERAREALTSRHEEGLAPILERRVVVVGEWDVVANPTMDKWLHERR